MTTTKTTHIKGSRKSSLSDKSLIIKTIETEEGVARFNHLAKEFHYMGEGRPAGDTLRMVVEADEKWVALLLWGSACYRLKLRDEHIGLTDQQRAARQKLVVQN